MGLEFYPHQEKAINDLRNGAILCGGVGTGKSRTALGYFFMKECEGYIPRSINNHDGVMTMPKPKDLYIITTARKRDEMDWEAECVPFLIDDLKYWGMTVKVDSWNNVHKYVSVQDAFFIFDEQRVVGTGTWVKSFLKITKKNNWILLSATPGDTWSDYIPVFLANGFYKNKTEFNRKHVVFNPRVSYPKIERYVDVEELIYYKKIITVDMPFDRHTHPHYEYVNVTYDSDTYKKALKERWDIYKDEPVENASSLCYLLRKIINSDISRVDALMNIYRRHGKVIVFYNYDYELDILRNMCDTHNIIYHEWNGHKHEPVPDVSEWIYIVQYAAGAEAWNCITCDTIVFFSLNYSYKITSQAYGRIDRLNTPFVNLFYYHIKSQATIDNAIQKALSNKKKFQENSFYKKL